MTVSIATTKKALPYIGLVIALVLSCWAFIRSEQYRAESDLSFSQSYEIQWRSTQIRERLTRVFGYLRLAAATGTLDPDFNKQMMLLGVNVDQLLSLEYLSKFLRDRDVDLLQGLQANLKNHIGPIAEGDQNYNAALNHMPDLEQRMFEVSGTAVAHAATLNEAAHIAAAASRNRFLFAMALAFVAVGYMIIHLRYAYFRRQDQHLRSFSSLYAHMTRSRVTALRMFLDYQNRRSVEHPEMLQAARDAVQQLESITSGLTNIAYSQRDERTESLEAILASIVANHSTPIDLDIEKNAAATAVPETQMRLILDELVKNAEAALLEKTSPSIKIRGWLDKRLFRKSRRLSLEVIDNGVGMPPDVLEKATTPFFSTKAGSHTGLGLTGCAQMVAALKGTFKMASHPGQGTLVQIRVPLAG
jgi:signal transduction histidine kinase